LPQLRLKQKPILPSSRRLRRKFKLNQNQLLKTKASSTPRIRVRTKENNRPILTKLSPREPRKSKEMA
jgi:hypothetical protein